MSLWRSHVDIESYHIETACLQGRRPHILVSTDWVTDMCLWRNHVCMKESCLYLSVMSYRNCLSARTPTPYLNEYRLSHRRVSMKKSCPYEGVMSLWMSHVISKLPVCRDAAPIFSWVQIESQTCLYEEIMSLWGSHVSMNKSCHVATVFLQGRRPHILVSIH